MCLVGSTLLGSHSSRALYWGIDDARVKYWRLSIRGDGEVLKPKAHGETFFIH